MKIQMHAKPLIVKLVLIDGPDAFLNKLDDESIDYLSMDSAANLKSEAIEAFLKNGDVALVDISELVTQA